MERDIFSEQVAYQKVKAQATEIRKQAKRIASLEAENKALREKLERAEKVVEAASRWRSLLTEQQIQFGVQAVRDLADALRAYKEG